ncbi:MAG: peptidoglycan D,D-transpeptidase FtsI family protein [Candidatus Aminicenantales bacterium]
MKSYYQKKVRKRTIFLAAFFLLWVVVILGRLIQLQVIEHPKAKARVIEHTQNRNKIRPKRGDIYDRNGTILARSVPRLSIFLKPDKAESAEEQWKKITRLAPLLELNEKKLTGIRTLIENGHPFIWIARQVEASVAERVKALNLSGISMIEENKRVYPQGRRASHVVGRVDIDGKGLSGVEYKYDALLGGKEGEVLILRDARRRRFHFETLNPPVDGKDLVLTLDETIQYIAEKELGKAIKEYQAAWGTIIISVPRTGEILAMANYPDFDPNVPISPVSEANRNRAVQHLYDPGSTLKIVTASAALENGCVGLEETFDCSQGYIAWGRNIFRDHKKFGVLSFPEVVIHSSNVGSIQIGDRVGARNLFEALRRFGFGTRTGIDLPAEERGILRPLEKWTDISTASVSIGYEIAVTPIQMLQTLNTVANLGTAVCPKVVKSIPGSDEGLRRSPEAPRRVISPGTARTMSEILRRVVSEGTGQQARIPGYTVVGKTGTAQKLDPVTKSYTSSAHIASFVGYVAKERPLFSMIVVIDSPKGAYYGSHVAAPVFREVAKKVLLYLGIAPEKKASETLIASRADRSPDG